MDQDDFIIDGGVDHDVLKGVLDVNFCSLNVGHLAMDWYNFPIYLAKSGCALDIKRNGVRAF